MSALSERNVELTRRVVRPSTRDIEGIVAHAEPRVEWRSTFATVGGGVQRGEVPCGNGIATSRTRGEGLRSEPEAHFDLGEHTLLFYVQRLGGADDAMPLALVARRHDGKAIDVKAYIHRADALNDLGRS